MTRVLITGAAGFIASHFIEAILKTTNWEIVALDRLDETSTLERIGGLDAYKAHRKRVRFVWHDLKAPINKPVALEIGQVTYVLHLAASTHVDRSIVDPALFVMDNVMGTCNLLNWAREASNLDLFVNFSTDETYGSAPEGVAFKETDRYNSGNPYSASKAGAIELCSAYHNTYGLPIVTTNCMNAIGERQAGEKVVPKFIRQILDGETLLIHADKTKTRPARRSYIHARNIWNAIKFLLQNGSRAIGERFNIVGDAELDCLELASRIGEILGVAWKHKLVDFHSDRPGHDLAYRLDGSKLRQMGFLQPVSFDKTLKKTVEWYKANPDWLYK